MCVTFVATASNFAGISGKSVGWITAVIGDYRKIAFCGERRNIPRPAVYWLDLRGLKSP
jgi:hypothetical protein